MRAINKYNIAIIGYGAFGRFLKRSWRRIPQVEVTAITRTSIERARASAEADGIPRYYADYKEVLADPGLDIVVVATPPYLHAEQAIAAMQAGKHVLIEKPLATTVSDGERVLQVAEETGRRAAVNFVMRYNPVVERVKRIAEQESLGKLYRVLQENYASCQGLGRDHWFWDISKSGGILVEHGVHFFDLTNYITGSEPADVHGFLTSREPGIEDKVMANVRYSNGTLATFYNSFSKPAAIEKTWAEYVFDRGEIVTSGWIPLELGVRAFVTEKGLADLREILSGGEFAVTPAEDRQVETCTGAYAMDHKVEAVFRLQEDKEEVYAQSAADLLQDLIASIEDPHHRMRVSLHDALMSLRVACAASDFRQQKGVYLPA